MFFKSTILVQMVLYFSNSFFSSVICKDINLLFFSLNVLTYPLISENIKTNGLINSFKYPIKYLELFLVSVKFEISILSTLTSQIFIGSLSP